MQIHGIHINVSLTGKPIAIFMLTKDVECMLYFLFCVWNLELRVFSWLDVCVRVMFSRNVKRGREKDGE